MLCGAVRHLQPSEQTFRFERSVVFLLDAWSSEPAFCRVDYGALQTTDGFQGQQTNIMLGHAAQRGQV